MKIIKKLLLCVFVYSLTLSTSIIAQNQQPDQFKPVFITVTKAHWSDDSNVDSSDWLKTEKEYFDKVTKKNDLIIASGYYTHYFTPDNSEVLIVNVYATWEDIEKSNEVTTKLVEAGWPDEAVRKAFFEMQSAYYSPLHSDEIYASLPFTKPVKSDSKKPLIYYIKKNISGNGGGSGFKEYFENITMKDPYLKGYYTHRHRWGANSQDAIEVFVFDKLSDLESSFAETTKLVEKYWPDVEKRKEFFKGYNKIFAGHGDFIYQNVPELQK